MKKTLVLLLAATAVFSPLRSQEVSGSHYDSVLRRIMEDDQRVRRQLDSLARAGTDVTELLPLYEEMARTDAANQRKALPILEEYLARDPSAFGRIADYALLCHPACGPPGTGKIRTVYPFAVRTGHYHQRGVRLVHRPASRQAAESPDIRPAKLRLRRNRRPVSLSRFPEGTEGLAQNRPAGQRPE